MTTVEVAATIAPTELIDDATLNDLNQYQNEIDIVELRIDQWPENHIQLLTKNLEILHNQDANFKVLVTYRTSSQGGKGSLPYEAYMKLLQDIVHLNYYHMIDIEWDSDYDIFAHRDLVRLAQENYKQVVVSYHNFQGTPDIDILKFTYYKMHQLNPDYVKIAVMPQCREDVATLLQAMAASVDAVYPKVIGISMSQLGVVSRVAQGAFGGSVSYGCLGEPQAPGQLHVKTLKAQLSFYENM
ncbi:type I 3-dehydroquinate dehydratase [Staphylococcus petrasii]|uniref:type I 3-dehydroquinate dehydratase n=1 Tax=Staphylococcus petrasii TaxID=1276936 RepID=UPI000CCFFB0B|nr:type I 3-dehydroquinate dehydratase [Staphylococcus petrasii]PNZ80448.1 type I 3-dehydroquinate dehydratase [Staphylococcus petrasii]TGA82241.1 type I 3-dehydroquinate dehydratase [Staphylococcus petrasii]SUM60599.1 3-dehydroquinate dehydratase [Staphylococcus petrasii]